MFRSSGNVGFVVHPTGWLAGVSETIRGARAGALAACACLAIAVVALLGIAAHMHVGTRSVSIRAEQANASIIDLAREAELAFAQARNAQAQLVQAQVIQLRNEGAVDAAEYRRLEARMDSLEARVTDKLAAVAAEAETPQTKQSAEQAATELARWSHHRKSLPAAPSAQESADSNRLGTVAEAQFASLAQSTKSEHSDEGTARRRSLSVQDIGAIAASIVAMAIAVIGTWKVARFRKVQRERAGERRRDEPVDDRLRSPEPTREFTEFIEAEKSLRVTLDSSQGWAQTGRSLLMALEAAPNGVILLDDNGRVAFANDAATTLDGFVEILRASLSVSAYSGGSLERPVDHEIRIPDGRVFRLSCSRPPHGGLLVFCSDVTARRADAADLASDTANLRAALDGSSHGLCLFDSDRRLAVVNRRYSEIYRIDADALAPGMTVRELITLSVDAGNHPGRTVSDLVTEARMEFGRMGAGSIVQQLGDGRVVQIDRRPTLDGAFVVTYEDVSERWHAEAKIAHMVRHDGLTGLANRLLFAERIEEAITQADRQSGFGVLFLDLDNFKPINDTLGHSVGDELLCAVGYRLLACLRENDTVARLGGDEFAIVRAGVESRRDVAILAKRLIEIVSEPYELAHHTVTIGVSIGITLAPEHGMKGDVLLKNADLALYRAKDDGRGTLAFFEPEMDAHLKARRRLELALRSAMASEAFDLHYQPIYDLSQERICGFEALLRWNDPERGNVSPVEFVPLAEEIGLIVPLGEWVVRRACREAANWPDELKVAVNISAAQFQSAQLVDVVRSALEESGLSPQRLELEITESVLLVNGAATLEILHALRNLGARVSMDDFGTGYSSLSYLRSFPFDKMKIDKSFIRDLTVENGSGFIVRAVISLGASLGMTMTAEGVETQAQLARLREEACDEVQGYLFSPPVPVSQVQALIEKWNTKPVEAAVAA